MPVVSQRLSASFQRFFHSEKTSGILLIACTMISLLLANSAMSEGYLGIWHADVLGLSVEHWINDGLMALFFLLIGLELERELYCGELSSFRNAILPIFAALGGVAVPALIHFLFNGGTPTQSGLGIPMATDIAFALAVLALLGSRVPASLKVFLAALAIVDDLVAILVIAVFYTAELSLLYLLGAVAVFSGLVFLNRSFRVMALSPYLLGGALMWFLMLKSGVHATIAGVMLAFAIPFSRRGDDQESPSHRLEHSLHLPVAYLILPLFALANTGVILGSGWTEGLRNANSLGIMGGLLLGKPLGIVLLTLVAVASGVAKLPLDLSWRHVIGAGFLGGIGFTMSIFITNLAFVAQPAEIDTSKIAILMASVLAGTVGFVWLKLLGQPTASDSDPQTMDFDVPSPRPH